MWVVRRDHGHLPCVALCITEKYHTITRRVIYNAVWNTKSQNCFHFSPQFRASYLKTLEIFFQKRPLSLKLRQSHKGWMKTLLATSVGREQKKIEFTNKKGPESTEGCESGGREDNNDGKCNLWGFHSKGFLSLHACV